MTTSRRLPHRGLPEARRLINDELEQELREDEEIMATAAATAEGGLVGSSRVVVAGKIIQGYMLAQRAFTDATICTRRWPSIKLEAGFFRTWPYPPFSVSLSPSRSLCACATVAHASHPAWRGVGRGRLFLRKAAGA